MSSEQIVRWGKWFADLFEDAVVSIVGFIPNGLASLIDAISSDSVARVIKMATGIALCQGLAADLAYYVGRPIGYMLGLLLGATPLLSSRQAANYQGKLGQQLTHFSGQTLLGAIMGIVVFAICNSVVARHWQFSVNDALLGAVIGATLGFAAKALVMISIEAVHKANSAAVRRNVERAQSLSAKLKKAARQKAKSRILQQAQDIIQQVNGPSAQQHLEEFLEQEYENFSMGVYKKVDRHFDYLADRACHGDIKALKRLQELIPRRQETGQATAFDQMLARIFNERLLFQLKDDIDTCYDKWLYRSLGLANATVS